MLLTSYGDTLGTLYPQAIVYGPNGSEVSGSPFTLTQIGNNLYYKAGAFQADLTGTYYVVYLVYTDAGHTTRSTSHGEVHDTITVKIQSTTGLGGYGSMKNGGDVIVDLDPIKKLIKDTKEELEKKIEKIQQDIDDGFKIDIPEKEDKEIIKEINNVKSIILSLPNFSIDNLTKKITDIQTINKNNQNKLIDAIKKNRSTIIKSKFERKMLQPMMESNANLELKTVEAFNSLKINLTKTIDVKNNEVVEKFSNVLEEKQDKMINILNELNEQVRLKVKYAFDKLARLFLSIKKQNINIVLKDDK